MSVTITPQGIDTGAILIESTAVNATLEPNITGGAGRLHFIKLVNALGNDAFFRIWDNDGSSVVNGTTAPEFILYVPGSDTVTYTFTDIDEPGGGVAFDGLSIACVKNEGVADGPGTEGTSNPTGNVSISAVATAS